MINKHDDMCPCTRFRAQDEFCTCGAVDRAEIVADVSEAFGKRLDEIMGAPAPAPSVLPLKWTARIGCEEFFSDTIVGRYEIGQIGKFIIATVRTVKEGQWEDEVFAHCLSVKKAKSAAQADFARRVTSALSTPSPAPTLGWVNVRVEDTGDGLIINPDDALKWRLRDDQAYEGHFLPDGTYRVAIPACLPAASEGSANE